MIKFQFYLLMIFPYVNTCMLTTYIFQDFPNGEYDSGGANVILYIGLGMVAMGLVITFVGLGDKVSLFSDQVHFLV